MTEEDGSATRYICPACGTRRGAGGRYCPGCGLDYWQLAAGRGVEAGDASGAPPGASAPGGARPPGTRPASVAPSRRSRGGIRVPGSPRSRLLLGGLVAAVALLLVAALIMRPTKQIASASPTASPTPAPPGPDIVIPAFFNAVRDPAAAFEVKITGLIVKTVGTKRTPGSISGDVRIVGDSWAGTFNVAQPGSPVFIGSVLRIGERSWTRVPRTAWREGPLPAGATTINPFAWIATVDELTYLRVQPGQAGARTHLIESTKWLNGTDYDAIVLALTSPVRDSSLVVVTTDDGVPLSATYRFAIRGTLSGASLVLSGSTSFTFSHWGERVAIGPPA